MTVSAAFHQIVRVVQPSRAYYSVLVMAAWTIGSCVTTDFLDYWLRRLWRSSFVARLWSRVHAWLWPF